MFLEIIINYLKSFDDEQKFIVKTKRLWHNEIMCSSDWLYQWAILNGVFPDNLKLADVKPLYNKSDPDDKTYYQLIIVNYPKSMKKRYQKQNLFFERKYNTQHALSNLLFNWQSCLDKSGVVGTILMDLSKALDCLLHDLIIGKLFVYGVYCDSQN